MPWHDRALGASRGGQAQIGKRQREEQNCGEELLGIEVEADLVVLAAGLVPRTDTDAIARILKLSKSSDRFLMEAHPKLRPVDTATDGVFLAGTCQGPKDIPDTVAQAKGAAASAIQVTRPGTADAIPARDEVDAFLAERGAI